MVDLTGYKLTFDDEFNARSISQNGTGTTWSDIRPQWRYDADSDIGFGHSSFLDAGSGYDPFSVAGGALSITAKPNPTQYGYPGSWASGLISTKGTFSQTYGYFEMRAQTASAPGSWDAFWMLPDKPTANQELDVMEHYGNNDPGTYSNIHTTDNTPASALQVYSQDAARTTGYHTYGMDWEPDRITFYVDGKAMGSQATPSDMHSPMYLLADLATQDNAAGASMTTKIDYIRAFSKDPAATAVAQGAVSAPDGKDPGLYGATTASTATTSSGTSTSPSTGTAAATVGTGSDKLVLSMSEDAYKGDAQYTVSVDGQQVGGVQTAHAAHGSATDTLTVLGDWAAGSHTVSVNFLNDLYEGSAAADRNLYVNGATYDGAVVTGAQNSLMSSGAKAFVFQDVDAAATTPSSGGSTTSGTSAAASTAPTSATVGTGSDKLVLSMSEDAYKGDAQYTVSVDGHQVGGVQTAHAAHGSATDTLTVLGDWAAGGHTVSVNFLNDLYEGSAAADRNLYINGATFDGAFVTGAQNSLMSSGAKTFAFQDVAPAAAASTSAGDASSTSAAPTSTTVGSGSNKLVLSMSEDAYKGDAQYTVSVDGHQVGGVQTAHAAHGSATDTLTVLGTWASGDHAVSVNFLNDLYGGSAAADRNLYINGATYAGASVSGSQHSLMSSGAQGFSFHVA